MTPIEQLMQQVEWKATNNEPSGSGLPYATHAGVMDLFGHKLRVYRLNDGSAIVHADDLEAIFGLGAEHEFPQ